MLHTSEKKLVLVAAWGLVLTGIVLVTQQTLLADEPKGTEGHANQCQVRVEVRGKMPFLDKIPLVKYFINTAVDEQPSAASAKDKIERIGVDFDLMPGHMVTFLPNGERQVIYTDNVCAACPQSNACFETKIAAQHCQACADGQCDSCADNATAVANHKSKPAQAFLEIGHACDGDRHHQACEHIAELRAENAALHAVHEARESMMAARSEMFEAMVGLATEKVKLEARGELIAAREEMREKLQELLSENGKLKATIELAEERQNLLKQSMQVALENERLKLRVAELEQRDPSPFAPSRTAKKSSQLK